MISKTEAKQKGLTRYFTGKPCKRGHASERYVAGGRCVACKAEDNRMYDPDKKKAQDARWREANKERVRDYARDYAKRNKEKIRHRQKLYQRKYRELDPEKFRERRRRRAGLPSPQRSEPDACECCGGDNGGRSLNLDHCHATGEFRGWLCGRCNTGIGLLGDGLAGVKAAERYLLAAAGGLLRDSCCMPEGSTSNPQED